VANTVITPEARGMQWDDFGSATDLVAAGEKAAMEALPTIQSWLDPAWGITRPTPDRITVFPTDLSVA
jgi:hypothetical protein